MTDYSVVTPTVGRPSLNKLLAALHQPSGPPPAEVVIVDDRPDQRRPLAVGETSFAVRVVPGAAMGPAAARNRGWRQTTSTWVAFLDDDVVPGPRWRGELAVDLGEAAQLGSVAGTQGRLRVPLPTGRRPTDWERNVAGLAHARWATADLAYRRDVLIEVGGFDERFPRAFREDADLGLRVTDAGYVILQGERSADHPVRAADRWVSLRLQAGNADDVLMRGRHGPGWRARSGAEPGRTGRHLATTACGAGALASAWGGRRRVAAVAGAGWLAGTAELVAARIRPGPRTAAEVSTMVLTSAALPALATAHWMRGWAALPRLLRRREGAPLGLPRSPLALDPPPLWRRFRAPRPQADPGWRPEAVLFDRDGTLIVDRPGNTDAELVALMPGARAAVARARAAGMAVGVVTNQAAIGRGTVSRQQVDEINRVVDSLCGPFTTWQVCPHRPDDGCDCRKPAPGLIDAAAAALGVSPSRCALIGDVGSDMEAARRAGARAVLVPTPVTRRDEIESAPTVAPTILGAVDLALAGMC